MDVFYLDYCLRTLLVWAVQKLTTKELESQSCILFISGYTTHNLFINWRAICLRNVLARMDVIRVTRIGCSIWLVLCPLFLLQPFITIFNRTHKNNSRVRRLSIICTINLVWSCLDCLAYATAVELIILNFCMFFLFWSHYIQEPCNRCKHLLQIYS